MVKKIKKERSLKAALLLVVIILLILFVAAFLTLSNWRLRQRRTDLVSQIKTLENEIQELEQRNQGLKTGLSQLSNEDYLEQMAREKLGLKKPGEEVVVVVPPSENEKKTQEEKKGFWQRVLEKLGF